MPILPLKPNLYTIFNHHVSTSAQTFGLSESELHWIWPHGWLKAIYVQRTAEFHWFPYLLWLRVAISDSSQKMTFAAQENDGGCCCCCCCCLCRYSHDRLCKLCIRIHIYTYIYIYYTHCSITVANLLSHPTIDSGVLGQSSHSHFIRRPRTML